MDKRICRMHACNYYMYYMVTLLKHVLDIEGNGLQANYTKKTLRAVKRIAKMGKGQHYLFFLDAAFVQSVA